MKRDDEFSKGLAGFIDKKISESKHAKNDKRDKINELKSLIEQALDGVDKKKKDVADSQGNFVKGQARNEATKIDNS